MKGHGEQPRSFNLPLDTRPKSEPQTGHSEVCVSQVVKNLPVVQATQVHSLGGEDPLEKPMATYSSVLFWTEKFCGQRSLAGYSPWDPRVGHDATMNTFTFYCPSVIFLVYFRLLLGLPPAERGSTTESVGNPPL